MRYRPGTALVVVDVQNDFADPAGSLHVAGAELAVARVVQEVGAATAAGARDLGFAVTVLADATAAVELHPGDTDAALAAMRAAGAVVEGAVGP